MPAPRWLARFNRVATNQVTKHVAPRLPGFGIVTHVGRKSGKTYTTPVNLFRRGDRFAFALTYGKESEWVKNVIAAGGCRVETEGQTYNLTRPQLVHDPRHRRAPAFVGFILALLKVDDFLLLSRADAAPVDPARPAPAPATPPAE